MAQPLSNKLDWSIANPIWASAINPVLSNALNNIKIINNVNIVTGTNVINHGLGRLQQGWIILDIDSSAIIYRSAPFNDKNLILTSSAPTTISIGVF